MINNEKNQGKENKREDEDLNLKSGEMGNVSNSYLGQLNHEQEGKTESFQGNWTGNYGNGYISSSGEESTTGNFVSQASNTGNGLNSDEDDLLASGQNIDDLGLGNNINTMADKQDENGTRKSGDADNRGGDSDKTKIDTSDEGASMPDPEDTTDQNEAASEDDMEVEDIIGDEGPGLATSGDFASMTGQNIADLNLPSDAEVASWRQDAGTIGHGSDDKEVVDDGRENMLGTNSGEFTTGKADKEGGWRQYPDSGDLGQVDPGQQNYVEDQDSTKAFRAGDYETSQERDPEEGSEKYTREKSKNVKPGHATKGREEG